MSDQPTDLIQGTLEMLILKTLALAPLHGYGIALRIEQISDGAFRVNPGSLLPALSRMERAGHVKGEWRRHRKQPSREVLRPDRKEVARRCRARPKTGAVRSPPSTASSRHSRWDSSAAHETASAHSATSAHATMRSTKSSRASWVSPSARRCDAA